MGTRKCSHPLNNKIWKPSSSPLISQSLILMNYLPNSPPSSLGLNWYCLFFLYLSPTHTAYTRTTWRSHTHNTFSHISLSRKHSLPPRNHSTTHTHHTPHATTYHPLLLPLCLLFSSATSLLYCFSSASLLLLLYSASPSSLAKIERKQ